MTESRSEPISIPEKSAQASLEHVGGRLQSYLVTPVNGQGLGLIVVSVPFVEARRTAAFLCDVQRGICDARGEVEPEPPRSSRLLEQLAREWEGDCVRDVPELARGLLAGTLLLSGAAVPRVVRKWLDATVGPEFLPAGLPAQLPGLDTVSVPPAELPARAHAVIEACPSWLDTSRLTFELAEEICLREGEPAVDSERDAGAHRFLFEHRLSRRLEMYRRMLLWMAWFWRFSGELELAQSAHALAFQLSDEQYAVPSHPFSRALAVRSLEAAQARLRTAEDPRSHHL
jgi:hypothetical protein